VDRGRRPLRPPYRARCARGTRGRCRRFYRRSSAWSWRDTATGAAAVKHALEAEWLAITNAECGNGERWQGDIDLAQAKSAGGNSLPAFLRTGEAHICAGTLVDCVERLPLRPGPTHRHLSLELAPQTDVRQRRQQCVLRSSRLDWAGRLTPIGVISLSLPDDVGLGGGHEYGEALDEHRYAPLERTRTGALQDDLSGTPCLERKRQRLTKHSAHDDAGLLETDPTRATVLA
jgi:hypothetical protein